MKKVVISHKVMEEGLHALEGNCRIIMPPEGGFTNEQLADELLDADAVLAAGDITQSMLAGAKKLKIISNHGAGYDRIDVAAATRYGIPVTNIPTATAIPTAEMALALLLCLERNMLDINRRLRSEPPENSFGMSREKMGHSLLGRRIGLIGMGHIGQKMAALCDILGMEVVYYARNRRDVPYTYLPLDELLSTCDVLSLHCPLTDETRSLIGERELQLMKPTSVLINTARGAVVDHDALIDALKNGRLRGAGLDVFPDEPHIPEGLLTLPHVVLMPHSGTNTFEARVGMVEACCERILDALDGKRPKNVVNPEIYAE